MAIPGSTDPTTTIAELDIRLAELSARALELGASPEEVTSLGGIVATPTNPITAIAQTAQAATIPVRSSPEILEAQAALETEALTVAEGKGKLTANTAAATLATEAIQGAITEVADAASMVTELVGLADMKAQQANLAVFEAAGGQDAQVALAKALKEEGDRTAALLDKRTDIMDDEHTGIALIDAVVNGFRSIQTEIELESAQLEQAQTLKQIQNISASTESANLANTLTKQTVTAASIEASTKSIAAKASIQASEVEIQNLHANSIAVGQIMQADARAVENSLSVARLAGDIESRELAMEQMEIAKKRMKIAMEQMELELPAAQARLEVLNLQLKDLKDPKRIAAVTAQREQTVKDIEDNLVLEEQINNTIQKGQSVIFNRTEEKETNLFKLKNPVTREATLKLQEIGASATNNIATNPADAIETLEIVAPENTAASTPGTQALQVVKKLLVEETSKLWAGQLPKDAASLKVMINNTAKKVYDDWEAEIKTGDTSNPLHAPPMDTLAAFNSVATDTFYQKVVAQQAMKEVNPEKILDLAVTGVIAKTVSPEEAAAGIVKLFSAAADHNNKMKGGLPRVGFPSQSKYNVLIPRERTTFEKFSEGVSGFFKSPFLLGSAVTGVVTGEKEEFKKLAGSILTSPFVTVDVMDLASVTAYIVQKRSATAAKPASAAPSTTPAVTTP